jgi:hypothetical protein
MSKSFNEDFIINNFSSREEKNSFDSNIKENHKNSGNIEFSNNISYRNTTSEVSVKNIINNSNNTEETYSLEPLKERPNKLVDIHKNTCEQELPDIENTVKDWLYQICVKEHAITHPIPPQVSYLHQYMLYFVLLYV